MVKQLLHIKNMVCPRCIVAVKDLLNKLEIRYLDIQLGQVFLGEKINTQQLIALGGELEVLGFELLEPGKSALISQIKSVIIHQVHHEREPLSIKFSSLIAEKLHHEYAHLSRLFSSVEGITIEKFIVLQRIEKVKEYLIYDQMTLSEIAYEMDYSSVAHLSAQFKKEIGMTPTQFRAQTSHQRRSIDKF
ncbi:MAG: AraC family transcriptional regulator [Cryomorphaceae bacterium]